MDRLLLIFTALLVAGCGEFSEGIRVGTLKKFSRKGVLFKTWEGEMYMGGFALTPLLQETWTFCVESEDVAKTIEAAFESGRQVKLNYIEELVVAPWRCGDGKYFITRVEVVPGGLDKLRTHIAAGAGDLSWR